MSTPTCNCISLDKARTLAGLFAERTKESPNKSAYRYCTGDNNWETLTWSDMRANVGRWQQALSCESVQAGDRVALMLRNCPDWVCFDQAALGLGNAVVPLYVNDRADNVAYILNDSGAKVLLIENSVQWDELAGIADQLTTITRIISLEKINGPNLDARIVHIDDWLPEGEFDLQINDIDPQSLATIVYTSGTTGKPKGVMLSHHNILWNASAASECCVMVPNDVFLSFLPLSHTFERTVGYYLTMMMGAEVAYCRSIPQIAEDLINIKPTGMISVPRIYERVYGKIHAGLQAKSPIAQKLFHAAVSIGWHRFEWQQKRACWHPKLIFWPILNALVASKVMARLGGCMRIAISGGAALSPEIAKTFIALGLEIRQGYGLTETSPILTVNPVEDNRPAAVGTAIPDVELRVGANDELLAKSPGIMMGYWNNEQATKDIIDAEGWLHTGDKARIEGKHVFITGRLKEIIVLANGENVPPADMEMAIALDGLFEQVMVIGEGKPYLVALVVLNPEQLEALAPGTTEAQLSDRSLERVIVKRISAQLGSFPGYAQVRRAGLLLMPWTVENNLITPTLKLRRNRVASAYKETLDELYAGHV